MSARVGGFFAALVVRMKGTELERETADAIGSLLAEGRAPSTSDVRKIVKARTGRQPAYGTVDRVLRILRGIGVLTWTKAHVRRWHGDRPSDEIGGPTPVRQATAYRRTKTGRYATGSFLLPVRNLALVGWAATLAAGGVASRAESIDSDARARLGSRVEEPRADSPVPEKSAHEKRLSLSIESAPRAEEPIADAWERRSELLPFLRE